MLLFIAYSGIFHRQYRCITGRVPSELKNEAVQSYIDNLCCRVGCVCACVCVCKRYRESLLARVQKRYFKRFCRRVRFDTGGSASIAGGKCVCERTRRVTSYSVYPYVTYHRYHIPIPHVSILWLWFFFFFLPLDPVPRAVTQSHWLQPYTVFAAIHNVLV